MQPTTTVTLISADRLKDLMAAKNTSTRKLAKAVDISPARVAQLAGGTFQTTSVETAVAIATHLEEDVANLFHFPDGEALIRLGLIRSVG